MKPLPLLIIVSLAANTLLAGYWIKSKSARVAPESLAASQSQASSNRSPFKRSTTTDSELSSDNPLALAGDATTWLDIQSADLKDFVRRLRAAGCPDETVKDIILAEVNRRFAVRNRELWPDRYQDYKFWKVEKTYDPERTKKQREQSRKDRELQKEKSALLVELLGVDPERQQRIEDGYEDFGNWQEQQVAYLPESKREAALKILDDFQDKEQEMYAANRGLWDAQSRAEQRQMQADKLAALAAVLSPAELREYELRQSQTASQLSYDLRNLSVNRDEYEAIFDVRKKYGDSIYNYGDIEGKEARQQVEENQKAMKADLAAVLGADKFKDYERGQDYSYQQLQRLAKKNDLPADTANKVYDYKTVAEDGMKKLRANKELTAEQSQTALQQLRTETENALKETLGEKAYKSYLKNGGWWLNNLAPQRSSAPGVRIVPTTP